jgi:hypothetical protein
MGVVALLGGGVDRVRIGGGVNQRYDETVGALSRPRVTGGWLARRRSGPSRGGGGGSP